MAEQIFKLRNLRKRFGQKVSSRRGARVLESGNLPESNLTAVSEYFFVQLNWHESHCRVQCLARNNPYRRSLACIRRAPRFFCYVKCKNDNIIMVILLRTVTMRQPVGWIGRISRTTKLFDNKCRADTKDAGDVSDARVFVSRDLRFPYCSSLRVNAFLMLANCDRLLLFIVSNENESIVTPQLAAN